MARVRRPGGADAWRGRHPSDRQIRALHERFAPAPQAFQLVYTHCEIVCDVAEQLLDGHVPALDVDLVRAGCLLHDVGVCRLYDTAGVLDHANHIRHGLLGHELLRELGLPERLCRFCSHHTGVGLSRGRGTPGAAPAARRPPGPDR
jgi:uncharacterized protein